MCSFGTTPGTINATSQATVLADNKPVATMQDCQLVNVGTFGMCSSLANPTVASATAAALGVLTPQPCTMTPAGVWMGGKPTCLAGGKPVLTNECKLMCGMGLGTISITNPGQMKVVVS